MSRILIASDGQWVRDEIRTVLADGDTAFVEITSGAQILKATKENEIDLAVLDLQMAQMGGIAACLDIRLEESVGRLPHIPVLLLLDRRPDVFLARRAEADGWLVKPLDPIRIRKACQALLEGKTYFDESQMPDPVLSTDAD